MSLPPVVLHDWEADVDKLRAFYLENCYQGVDEFGAEVSAAVLDGAQYLDAPPEEYWPLTITTLSESAQEQQDALDEIRGIPWQEHQESLSPKERLRSLLTYDMHYDPAVDERRYTHLVEAARGHYIEDLRERFEGDPGRTRFTKLRAGEAIRPHVDSVPRHIVRAIIPVWTNDECFNGYTARGEHFETHLELGKVYVINAGLPHWAYNHGEHDRVHLIVTLKGSEDLKADYAAGVNSVNRMGI